MKDNISINSYRLVKLLSKLNRSCSTIELKSEILKLKIPS